MSIHYAHDTRDCEDRSSPILTSSLLTGIGDTTAIEQHISTGTRKSVTRPTSLSLTQVDPDSQTVPPVCPFPPHWPHFATVPPPLLGGVVVVLVVGGAVVVTGG